MFVVLYNCQRTQNKNERGCIMIIAVLVLFGLIGLGLWFTEETKIGKKLSDKMYDYFMEN